MRTVKIALAMLVAAALLSACGLFGKTDPTTTAADAETTALADTETTETPQSTAASQDSLIDFALLDRLFSMTYADFCREEGKTVEPEGVYEGAVYCYFGKYGESSPFFFDMVGSWEDYSVLNPEANYLNAVFLGSEQLTGRPAVSFGELKQWLGAKGIECTARRYSEYSDGVDGIRFFFEWEKYEIMGDLDSEKDSAPVEHFEIYCKSNYD